MTRLFTYLFIAVIGTPSSYGTSLAIGLFVYGSGAVISK